MELTYSYVSVRLNVKEPTLFRLVKIIKKNKTKVD